jgi:ubiquinone/menaquinone biosynthesis C-methylase UbiE
LPGIERDTNQLGAARKNHVATNLECRQGDALDLPLTSQELESFDFTHARFLLEHLGEPAKAVSEMVKSLNLAGELFWRMTIIRLLRYSRASHGEPIEEAAPAE